MRRAVLVFAVLALSGCASAPEQVVSPPPQPETTAFCATAERGARIRVTATNNSSRPMICQVTCTFQKLNGGTDSMSCDGTVAGGANAAPFCENVDRRRRVRQLTNTVVDCTFAQAG
ncbi:hypothetical protein [Phreatobacter stygius]|uniref:Uncharacterized protein n=1 Tax=Phreatobacter stygius TaxID=1940610 RepID=A0A4D7B3I7_9HYPH|nr:hypothetical protein [Phreatobacter stygius]QCI64610.1 hypothetical protein E8M01_10450 [Phreatobacter stygius]